MAGQFQYGWVGMKKPFMKTKCIRQLLASKLSAQLTILTERNCV